MMEGRGVLVSLNVLKSYQFLFLVSNFTNISGIAMENARFLKKWIDERENSPGELKNGQTGGRSIAVADKTRGVL